CEIHGSKLPGLGRRRVSDADQLQVGVAGGDTLRERLFLERISEHDLASGGDAGRRTAPRQGADRVPPREQARDDGPADIARPSGDKDEMRTAHLLEVPPVVKLIRSTGWDCGLQSPTAAVGPEEESCPCRTLRRN